MLDMLPGDLLWSDKKATFLDPGCKSGVFLREIVKRLDTGLEKQIPNRQERLNHILKNQVFGLGITELTALLSRRSIYCSKTANGKYSVGCLEQWRSCPATSATNTYCFRTPTTVTAQ
jgi:site-specific DNA-methyltransferase (adenine-specific)